jgi:hypothetical protein
MKIKMLSKYALCALVSIGTVSAIFADDDDYDSNAVEREVEKGENAIHSGGTIGADKGAEHWGKALDEVTGGASNDSSESRGSGGWGAQSAR